LCESIPHGLDAQTVQLENPLHAVFILAGREMEVRAHSARWIDSLFLG
jgi:hypothetical protein